MIVWENPKKLTKYARRFFAYIHKIYARADCRGGDGPVSVRVNEVIRQECAIIDQYFETFTHETRPSVKYEKEK